MSNGRGVPFGDLLFAVVIAVGLVMLPRVVIGGGLAISLAVVFRGGRTVWEVWKLGMVYVWWLGLASVLLYDPRRVVEVVRQAPSAIRRSAPGLMREAAAEVRATCRRLGPVVAGDLLVAAVIAGPEHSMDDAEAVLVVIAERLTRLRG